MKIEIEQALNNVNYSPSRLIETLKSNPRLRACYEGAVSPFRSTNLEYHTLLVLNQYERYFSTRNLPIEKSLFRFMLALHDIGKPDAIRDGNKSNQYKYTDNIIKVEVLDQVPFTADDMRLCQSIIFGDPLGDCIRGRKTPDASAAIILEMSHNQTKVVPMDFLHILTAYYQCDAGSYTKDATRFNDKRFVLKNDIEHIFENDASGFKVFDTAENILLFSAPAKKKYSELVLAYKSILCNCFKEVNSG